MTTQHHRILCAAATAAALLLAAAVQADTATVTAVEGATVGGEPLAMHGRVADGQTIETAADGRCSMLLAEEAVLQVCNRASLQFDTRTASGASVLSLERGELKATVGKRESDRPLEIHTPVAIASLLGTIVHVWVDPETGVTTITSLESRVAVENADPDVEGRLVLEPGDQATVHPGESPRAVASEEVASLAKLSECLDDEDFRQLALRADKQRRSKDLLGQIAAMDVPDGLPGVGSPMDPMFDVVKAGRTGGRPDVVDVCFPTGCDPSVQTGGGGGGMEPGRGDIPVFGGPGAGNQDTRP
ncbi:MAG: FecR family protein [Proteobacteria bacterium]|nr:FecR family protein [Pseudomonadota bacterium]